MTMDVLHAIADTLQARRAADPSSSYVASLFHKGEEAILKKVVEEAVEVVMASKEGDTSHLVCEVADLWFHCLVLLTWHGLRPEDVMMELKRREGLSGIEEKKQRASKQ